jgi:hypothetical protein
MTILRFFIIASAAASLGACVAAPPRELLAPADANARVPGVRNDTVTAGTKTFRPAEPKNWEELNRRVGPKS